MKKPSTFHFTLTVKGRRNGNPFRIKWINGSLVGFIPAEELKPGESDETSLVNSVIEWRTETWKRIPESSTMKYAMSRNLEDPNWFTYMLDRLPDLLPDDRIEIEEVADDPPGHLELLRSMQHKVYKMFPGIYDWWPTWDLFQLYLILEDPRHGPHCDDPEKDPYPTWYDGRTWRAEEIEAYKAYRDSQTSSVFSRVP